MKKHNLDLALQSVPRETLSLLPEMHDENKILIGDNQALIKYGIYEALDHALHLRDNLKGINKDELNETCLKLHSALVHFNHFLEGLNNESTNA